MLQSLDVMESISSKGFMNSHDVSTELVKFIAQNVDFDTIKDLSENARSQKRTVEELKKSVQDASKKADTSANKTDQLKEQVKSNHEKLSKRIKTLEDRA